jgi:hypothetical protein
MGDEKLLVWGQTDGGRYLQVVIVFLSDERVSLAELTRDELLEFESGERVMLVIHAMEMTEDMKRQYRKLKGRR